MRRCLPLLLFCLLVSIGLHADPGPVFDLSGPKVDVHVKRGEVTLPIGEVPNLLPGDRLWIHPDFPESQSAHYVLIVAFLRGATNPPPRDWFTRVETWTREAHEEGVFVTVPQEAQQALVFLAPETGGDLNTLRNAVMGRPGAFVRATQDLLAASADRMRLNAYLDEVKVTSETDPKLLKERAEKAAHALAIKVDQGCFDKPPDQQAACLMQHTDTMVLDDSNAQARVTQLVNGSTGDLMNQLSYSNLAGGGLYSPYVGAIVDTVKILGSLHTAHFQYIPALALPKQDTLNLKLNTPPSFRDPKSVVVVALPPVGPATPPPLHPSNASEKYCAEKPGLVLDVEGAPMLFASPVGRELALHIESHANGKTTEVDLPVKADAAAGGLVLESPAPPLPEGELTAELHGKWGFDNWTGPRFHLRAAQAEKWTVAASDQSALIVGREDTLHLEGDSTLCVDKVEMQVGKGGAVTVQWKSPKPEQLELSLPLKDAEPGSVTVEVHQFGLEKPDKLPLTAYAEAASLERLTLSAGEPVALLRGTRLDQVAKAELEGMTLTPAKLTRVQDEDQLAMHTDGSTANLEPGRHYTAKVRLLDGRELKTPVTVEPPRPHITLLSKGMQDGPTSTPLPVHLGSADDLPDTERLVFFVKSEVPANFPRDEKLEVSAADGSFQTLLSLADGGLMLEDGKTAMATIDPLARFGYSGFGPIEARAVAADGAVGDWLPLGTLVRVPGFKELRCPRAAAKTCTLSGSNLFLATSIAATADFDNAVDVPADFTGTQLTVPHPVNGALYLKLRDDPATVQTLMLPVLPLTPSGTQATAMPSQPLAAPAGPVSTGAASTGPASTVPVVTPAGVAEKPQP